jgi:hypothetical protein
MSIEQFIINIQKYYGAYSNDLHKRAVAAFLKDLDDQDRKELFNATIKSYSTKWKNPPDVAILEETKKANNIGTMIDQFGNVLRNNKRIGHFDGPRFIPVTQHREQIEDKRDYSKEIADMISRFMDKVDNEEKRTVKNESKQTS